ncbi:hypothetical protein RI129_005232 [Pyrocoelia pectoralis]|uniref:Uncharacterized protein n=1 Tax=Pyrocoelia pectoralis TaxID=417401 RepID=A0AAN7VJE4_9COLE
MMNDTSLCENGSTNDDTKVEKVPEHRHSSLDSNETPPKKIRKKSEPKIIDDMKEYLDSDTLQKLTTTTLRYWLKQHQVHCTTREKKDDLLQKVKQHFEKNEV